MPAVWRYRSRWSLTRSRRRPSRRRSRPLRAAQQAEPAGEPAGGHGQLDVGGRLLGVGDVERLVLHAQQARADGAAADRDDVRQVELGVAQLAGHHAAEARVLHRAGGGVAGVHLVGGPLVVAFLAGHRPDQGDFAHHLRGLLPPRGDLDAGDGGVDGLDLAAGLGARLGVEGLHLAGAAGHPQEDDGHVALAQVVGVDGHQVGEAQPGHPGRAQAHPAEEPAAADHPLAIHRHFDDGFLGHRGIILSGGTGLSMQDPRWEIRDRRCRVGRGS